MKDINPFDLPCVDLIDNAITGASFHGENWVKCPECGEAYETMGLFASSHTVKQGDYTIVRCDCGKLFKT